MVTLVILEVSPLHFCLLLVIVKTWLAPPGMVLVWVSVVCLAVHSGALQ